MKPTEKYGSSKLHCGKWATAQKYFCIALAVQMPAASNRYGIVAALTLSLLLSLPASAQWQIVTPAPTTADLRGIDNVGNGVAWASGTDGTVLRTTDDGAHWQRCSIPPGAEHLDFRGIQAFDAQTAIVMSSGKGPLSRLYKTTDGCQTWTLLFTNPDPSGFWDAIQFRVADNLGALAPEGIVIGDPVAAKFPIFETQDRGNSWTRWGRKGLGFRAPCGQRDAKAYEGEALFAASNESVIFADSTDFLFVTGGASGAKVIYSSYSDTDFGPPCSTRFSYMRIPVGDSTQSSGAFAVGMTKWQGLLPTTLMIVGGDYTKQNDDAHVAVVAIEHNGGHWFFNPAFDVITPISPPHGYRSAVAYDEKSKTWITVGPNGTDISTDDGRNWRALRPDPKLGDAPDADQHWNALSLPYVVGPHGRIGILRRSALEPAKAGK